MNLDDAIDAHAEWKTKLRSAINRREQVDAPTISSDNKCPLGQWLRGDAAGQYASLASYADCVAKHAEFHRCAGNVATKINAGKFAEAEAMLADGTPYSIASNAAQVAIIILRRDARL
jgi:methyl-accepting chemotaxis protein